MNHFPIWASFYLSLFCDPDIREELEGDILSNYNWRREVSGRTIASLYFLLDVISATRFLFSQRHGTIFIQLFLATMTAYFRNIKKNRFSFTLNIAGLSVGFFVFLSIYSFYQFEHSYDTGFSSAENIFRIEKIEAEPSEKRVTGTSYMLSQIALQQISGISEITGCINMRYDRASFQYPKGNPWHGLTLMLVKDNFFHLFDWDFIEGNSASAMIDPSHMVITETTRQKVFGDRSALHKTIYLNDKPYEISGVVALPKNTHFEFDFVLGEHHTFSSERWDKKRLSNDWHYADFIFHYAKIKPDQEEQVTASLNALYDRHRHVDQPPATFKLHPVSDIHLDPSTDWELSDNGDQYFVDMVMVLAFVVLILVTINYSFINIAQTTNRIRELGLRHILGSSSSGLLLLIFLENLMSVGLAAIVAFVGILITPDFSVSLPIDVYPVVLLSLQSISVIILVVFLIASLAAIYPFYMVRFLRPMAALKGKIASQFGNFSMLKNLATIQVMICLGLIISMLFFYRQLDFLLEKDPGFEVANLGYLERYDRGPNRPGFDAFKTELLKIPGIKDVTSSAQIPLRWPAGNNYELVLKGQDQGVMCSRAWIDYDYFKTLDLEIIEGRSYSRDIPSDTAGIVIGASAADQLGLKQPLGKSVNIFFRGGEIVEERRIIGVVEDFNYRSFHSGIMPHYYVLAPNGPVISINFEDINAAESLEAIQALWPKYAPSEAYNFTYMADHFRRQYKSDIAQRNAVLILAGVVLFLASMGIFGISSFAAKKSIKSISIRKVLGASVSNLYLQEVRQYLMITMASFVLCVAPVYLIISHWLNGYAYRIQMQPMYFLAGFLMVSVIIIGVVTGNILKVAIVNPVKTLKDE